MINPHDADHAVGLELQIEELVEQRTRAQVQGRPQDAGSIDAEIAGLYTELADTVERAASSSQPPPTVHLPDSPP